MIEFPNLDALMASDRLQACLGDRIDGPAQARLLKVAQPGGFHVYEIGAAAGRAILRLPVDEAGVRALEREERIVHGLRSLVALEIPDTSFCAGDAGIPLFAVHKLVEGEPLTTEMLAQMSHAGRRQLVASLVEFMLQVHGVDLDIACEWCGDVSTPWFRQRYGKPGWFSRDLVERSRGLLDPDLDAGLQRLLAVTLSDFEAIEPRGEYLRLVHGDLHGYNLAMREEPGGWRLGGVFDFGIAGILDAHEDLFRLNFVGKGLVREVVEAYNRHAQRAVTLQPRRIDVYYRAFLFFLMIEQLEAGDREGFELYVALMRRYL